jgi:hypothetical protein
LLIANCPQDRTGTGYLCTVVYLFWHFQKISLLGGNSGARGTRRNFKIVEEEKKP